MMVTMGFFRLQSSYSNLLKQVGILSPSIQIVFQNIENSSIREHVKIGLLATFMDIKTSTNFAQRIFSYSRIQSVPKRNVIFETA